MSDAIRIDFPVYGSLRDRAADLLEQGVKQGGIFLRANEFLQPGAALQMMFVDEKGREQFYLNTFVTKVRRSEPHEQVFVCFAELREAREALERIRDLEEAEREATLANQDPATQPDPLDPQTRKHPVETTGDVFNQAAVLVVHPDLLTREKISQELQGEGFQVCTTDDGLNALAVLEAFDADAIVAWARCERLPGFELPSALRQRDETRHIAVIVLYDEQDTEAVSLATDGGADEMVTHGSPIEEIAKAIRTGIAHVAQPES